MDSPTYTEHEFDPEIQRLELRAEVERLERWELVTRALRILCGGVIVVIGYLVLDSGPSVGSTPFSSLTLNAIAIGLFHVVGGVWLMAMGLWAAFGAGPSSLETRAKAAANLEQRKRFEAAGIVISPSGNIETKYLLIGGIVLCIWVYFAVG